MRHVFAGTFARTMAQTFIHPIDTIKTRLQVRSPPKAVKAWKKSIKPPLFKFGVNWFGGKKKTIKIKNFFVGGPRDVYLGVTGSILGTLPVGFAYFAAYEACKSWLESTWSCMKCRSTSWCGTHSFCLGRIHGVTLFLHRVVP